MCLHADKTTVLVVLEKMSVDIDATADLLLLIQLKLRIVQYRYVAVVFPPCIQVPNVNPFCLKA